MQHKTGILPPMVPRGIRPRLQLSSLLLRASKDTLVVNSLASVLQVIQLKEQHSQVMEFPQLPKLAMEINYRLSLDMGLATEHLKLRNLLPIPQFMGSLHSHPAPLEAMASLPLCSQDILILSHQRLVMLSQILVRNVPRHPIMVLQLDSQVMGLHLMVRLLLVSQVMDRHHHHTIPMVVLTHSLRFILLMAMLVGTLVGPMMQHLLLRLLHRVELPKHRPRVNDIW